MYRDDEGTTFVASFDYSAKINTRQLINTSAISVNFLPIAKCILRCQRPLKKASEAKVTGLPGVFNDRRRRGNRRSE